VVILPVWQLRFRRCPLSIMVFSIVLGTQYAAAFVCFLVHQSQLFLFNYLCESDLLIVPHSKYYAGLKVPLFFASLQTPIIDNNTNQDLCRVPRRIYPASVFVCRANVLLLELYAQIFLLKPVTRRGSLIWGTAIKLRLSWDLSLETEDDYVWGHLKPRNCKDSLR